MRIYLQKRHSDEFTGKFIFQEKNETKENSGDKQRSTSKSRAEQLNERIDKALENPLRFSARDIRVMEENFNDLTLDQKQKFRDIVGYYVSLSQEQGIGNLPPRVMGRIASSPKLRRLIPAKMREAMELELNENIQKLGSIVGKGADSWSIFDASRVCTLYRRLRKRAVDRNGKLDKLFQDAQEKLVAKATKLLVHHKGVGGKVETILAGGESGGDLSTEEKLLISEILRLFPNEKDWGNRNNALRWQRMAGSAITEIIKDKDNPKYFVSWELLADILDEENPDFDLVQQNILNPHELKSGDIEKFIEKTNAIQFLKFAENGKMFLPSHLRTLKNIVKATEKGDLEWRLHADWDNLEGEKKEIAQLKKRLADLQQPIAEYIDKNSEDENVIAYKEADDRKNQIINAFWENNVNEDPPLKSLSEELNALFDREIVLARETGSSIENQRNSDISLWENKKSNFNELISFAFKEELQKAETPEEREKLINKIDAAFDAVAIPTTKKGELQKFTDWESDFKGFDEKIKKQNALQGAAKDKFELSSQNVLEIKELEEEIKKKQGDFEKQSEETSEIQEYRNIFQNGGKIAEGAKKKYIEQLYNRFKNHQLAAVDMEVLWSGEFQEDFDKSDLDFKHLINFSQVQSLRGKFDKILTGIIQGVDLPGIQDGEDKFSAIYAKLDEALGKENIENELKKSGIDLRKEFPSPQEIGQLITGAVMHFQEEIFDNVLARIGESNRDEFIAGWRRVHTGLWKTKDIQEIETRFVSYKSEKQRNIQNIEEAHETHQAFVEKLREKAEKETDPNRKAQYLKEAELLDKAFQVRSNVYQNGGYYTDESGRKIYKPGKEVMTEISLQTQSNLSAVRNLTSPFKNGFTDLQKQIHALKDEPDPVEKELQQKYIGADVKALVDRWHISRSEIGQRIKDMKSTVRGLLPEDVDPDEFLNLYFGNVDEAFNRIDNTFELLRKGGEHYDWKFQGNETFWTQIPRDLQMAESFLDFGSGQMAKYTKGLNGYLESSNKASEFLEKNQFFDDQTADKVDFSARFKTISDTFRKNFNDYKKRIGEVERKIKNDVYWMSDDRFKGKYGFDKDQVWSMLEEHKKAENDFSDLSKKFLSPDFLSNFLKRYKKSPEDRANALSDMSDWDHVSQNAGEATKSAKGLQDWLVNYKENAKGGSNGTWQRFSLYDIYAIVVQCIEINDTRWKRNSDKAVANIGQSVFGNDTAWGKEFRRKSEDSEATRVTEFQTEKDSKNGWDIQADLYKTNDPDEAKACINLLIEKGFMKWDDKDFWRMLERLQSGVRFPDSLYYANSDTILSKVGDACELIWSSKEDFRGWKNSMNEKSTAAQNSYEDEFGKYEHLGDARSIMMSDMLRRWDNGDRTNVDPAKFEGFLRFAFKMGKMNGGPAYDQRWYLLIQGVASGLISRDALTRLNGEFLQGMPHVDFFTDKEGWKKDGKIVPEGTSGAEKRDWKFEDYQHWANMIRKPGETYMCNSPLIRERSQKFFYTVIHQSPYAQARVQRMLRGGSTNFDHDDGALFAPEMGADQVISLLVKQSNDENKLTEDFWRNVLSGYNPYFKTMYEYIKEGDAEYGSSDENWKKHKGKILIEIGERMRAAFAILQTIQGNVNLSENNKNVLMFGQTDWEKKGDYSPFSASESKNNIYGLIGNVFQSSGTIGEYGDLLTMNRREEGKPALKDVNDPIKQKINNLVKSGVGDKIFHDTEVVWKSLQQQFGGGKIVSMGGSMAMAA